MTVYRAKVIEPLVITVKRYVCPFCSRGRSSRNSTAAHIGRCWKNPDTRACKTCFRLQIEPAEPEVGYPGGMWCEAGIDLEDGTRVVTGCPSWEPKYQDPEPNCPHGRGLACNDCYPF